MIQQPGLKHPMPCHGQRVSEYLVLWMQQCGQGESQPLLLLHPQYWRAPTLQPIVQRQSGMSGPAVRLGPQLADLQCGQSGCKILCPALLLLAQPNRRDNIWLTAEVMRDCSAEWEGNPLVYPQ